MTDEQRASALRAQVIDSLKRDRAPEVELDDFIDAFRAALDTGEQIFICRQWIAAILKVRRLEQQQEA